MSATGIPEKFETIEGQLRELPKISNHVADLARSVTNSVNETRTQLADLAARLPATAGSLPEIAALSDLLNPVTAAFDDVLPHLTSGVHIAVESLPSLENAMDDAVRLKGLIDDSLNAFGDLSGALNSPVMNTLVQTAQAVADKLPAAMWELMAAGGSMLMPTLETLPLTVSSVTATMCNSEPSLEESAAEQQINIMRVFELQMLSGICDALIAADDGVAIAVGISAGGTADVTKKIGSVPGVIVWVVKIALDSTIQAFSTWLDMK